MTDEKSVQLSAGELIHIEEDLQRLIDSNPDPVIILKCIRNEKGKIEDFRYRLVNLAACNQLGMDYTEITKFTVSEIYPSFKDSILFSRYLEVLNSGNPISFNSFEYASYNHSGRTRDLYDIEVTPFCDGLLLYWKNNIRASNHEVFIHRQKKQEEIINDISRELSETLQNYRSLLLTVTRRLAETEGDTCVLRLVSEDGTTLLPEAFYHPDQEAMEFLKALYSSSALVLDDRLAGTVIIRGKALLIPKTDPEKIRNSFSTAQRVYVDKYPVHSYVAVPLRAGKQLIGVISMTRSKPEKPYDEDDLQFIQRLADLSALAIHNSRLYDQRLREIREKEILEQKLRHSNIELEMFAYAASHDLQEPLRMVTGYLQLLMNKCQGKLDKKHEEYLALAFKGAKDMIELIHDLLTYSRLTTKSLPFEMTDLNTVMEKVLKSFAMLIEETHAQISCDKLPSVEAEPIQMYQLFDNLIGNGLKYKSGETPQIHISVCENGANWQFCVKDNGIGISPEFFDRIFMMFQRLHEKTSYPGTGIGLALCRKIVENHSGRIWVESEFGKGSAFFFTLPAQRDRI